MLPCIGCLKEQIQQITGYGAKKDTKNNGHGNVYEVHHISMPTLCHPKEGGEEYDNKNIIAG